MKTIYSILICAIAVCGLNAFAEADLRDRFKFGKGNEDFLNIYKFTSEGPALYFGENAHNNAQSRGANDVRIWTTTQDKSKNGMHTVLKANDLGVVTSAQISDWEGKSDKGEPTVLFERTAEGKCTERGPFMKKFGDEAKPPSEGKDVSCEFLDKMQDVYSATKAFERYQRSKDLPDHNAKALDRAYRKVNGVYAANATVRAEHAINLACGEKSEKRKYVRFRGAPMMTDVEREIGLALMQERYSVDRGLESNLYMDEVCIKRTSSPSTGAPVAPATEGKDSGAHRG